MSSKLGQATLYPSTQLIDDRSTAIPPLFTNKSSYQAARPANRSNVQRSHFSNLSYQPTKQRRRSLCQALNPQSSHRRSTTVCNDADSTLGVRCHSLHYPRLSLHWRLLDEASRYTGYVVLVSASKPSSSAIRRCQRGGCVLRSPATYRRYVVGI